MFVKRCLSLCQHFEKKSDLWLRVASLGWKRICCFSLMQSLQRRETGERGGLLIRGRGLGRDDPTLCSMQRLDKNLGRLCEDREETMGGASHFLAPSHTASIRETIKIPWNTHTERDQLAIGIQESSMKSIWRNDGRGAPANTAQRQIVEKGQNQIKAP